MRIPKTFNALIWMTVAILLAGGVYLGLQKMEGFNLLPIAVIDVEGNKHTAADAIIMASGFAIGQPLFGSGIGQVTGAVERLPWVKKAVVFRRIPDTVAINVEEWEASYLVSLDRLYYMTDDAHVIDAPLDNGLDFPVVTGISWARLEAPGAVRDQLLKLLWLIGKGAFDTSVDEINFDARRGFTLFGDEPWATGVYLGSDDFETKLERFAKLRVMLKRQGRHASTVDLCYEDRIVARLVENGQ